jgi:hypothetical protein
LRPGFLNSTNPDVVAFHEAIADIAAIFLHFSLPGVVASVVASTRADLTDSSPLVELAQQFGYATGRRAALRSAIDQPDADRYQNTTEPHERGAVLVSAVFDAFVQVYQRRIADLLRLSTGGTGTLPPGSLPPDLVNRVAAEATRTSRHILTMCLRGLDYLPPSDVTFADFLQAVVTADRELFPSDNEGLRAALIESCRRRGIFPVGVVSLADAAVAFRPAGIERAILTDVLAQQLVTDTLRLGAGEAGDDEVEPTPDRAGAASGPRSRTDLKATVKGALAADPELVARLGFCPFDVVPVQLAKGPPVTTFRYDEDGSPCVTFVFQLTQRVTADHLDAESADDLGPLLDEAIVRATTLVVDHRGRARYVIARPLPGPGLAPRHQADAQRRLETIRTWAADITSARPMAPFGVRGPKAQFLRIEFAGLHGDQP